MLVEKLGKERNGCAKLCGKDGVKVVNEDGSSNKFGSKLLIPQDRLGFRGNGW